MVQIHQELIDWIKAEKEKGYTAEQLHNTLMQYDNEEEEVSEALKIVFELPHQEAPSSGLWPILFIGIVLLVVGGIWFYFSGEKTNDTIELSSIEKTQEEVIADKEVVEEEAETPNKNTRKPIPAIREEKLSISNLNVLGPYENVANIEFTDDRLSFSYTKDGKYYYKINNQDLGPYDNLYVSYDDFEDVFDVRPRPTAETPKIQPFGFFMYEKDGQKYYNANGQSFIANDYFLLHGEGPSSASQLKVSKNNWMYIDVQKNGLIGGQQLVITKDEAYGPYTYVLPNFKITDNNIAFVFYEQLDDWNEEAFRNYTIKINDLEIPGKDMYIQDIYKDFDVKENVWALRYQPSFQSEERYIKINNQEYGPFKSVKSVEISDNNWAFVYQEESKCFVNVKNDIYGPYGCSSLDLKVSDNHWAITTQKEDGLYIIVDNKEYGPYTRTIMDPFIVMEGDDWWYKIDNQVVFHKNGKDMIAEKVAQKFVTIKESENYLLISYTDIDDNNKEFIMVNGVQYGPYEKEENRSARGIIGVTEDEWAFWYKIDGKYYINANDIDYGPYDTQAYYMDGKIISVTEKEDKKYLNIDGIEQGPYELVSFSNNGDFWIGYGKKDNLIFNINGTEVDPHKLIKYNDDEILNVSSLTFNKNDFTLGVDVRNDNTKKYKHYLTTNKDIKNEELNTEKSPIIGTVIVATEEEKMRIRDSERQKTVREIELQIRMDSGRLSNCGKHNYIGGRKTSDDSSEMCTEHGVFSELLKKSSALEGLKIEGKKYYYGYKVGDIEGENEFFIIVESEEQDVNKNAKFESGNTGSFFVYGSDWGAAAFSSSSSFNECTISPGKKPICKDPWVVYEISPTGELLP